MGYVCEWAAGQCVYLDNVDSQTRVIITSSSVGQQQQASSSFQTGNWTAPPEVLRVAIGVVVKLFTAQGERFVHIQGNSVSTSSEAPFSGEAQPIQVQHVADIPASTMTPMTPMSPLPPIRMGDMQMDQKTMTMQMGRMRMEMPIERSLDQPPQTSAAKSSESAVDQRNFCSQCGSAIKSGDRFCASCGHHLA